LKRHGWHRARNGDRSTTFWGPQRGQVRFRLAAREEGLLITRWVGALGSGWLVQGEHQLLELVNDDGRSDELAEVFLEAWEAVLDIRARALPRLNLSGWPCDSSDQPDGSRDMPAAGDRGAAGGRSVGGTSVAWAPRGLA